MIQTLVATENFVVTYQDTNFATNPPSVFTNARRRAEQLQARCEADFDVLKNWFGLHDGFGSSNRVTLQIQPETLARNNGYQLKGRCLVTLNPFDDAAVQEEGDDAVQALFVAEMIEVMMSYRNVKNKVVSWHPDKSDGEGLSIVAAATLHPVGYYRLALGPRVNTWLKSDRSEDWVSANEDTDQGALSYGCAALFIYYLRDQLQHSLGDIIRHGGETLDATYKNLTGLSGGFAPFKALLNKYLPHDANDPARQMRDLVSDDPFPIREGNDRRVGLRFSQTSIAIPLASKIREASSVMVRPFHTCPLATYQYFLRNLHSELKCTASVEGFAQPVFSWRVNGLQASPGGSIMATVAYTVDRAAHPDEPANGSGVAHLQWDEKIRPSTYDDLCGELDISNASDNHLGHEFLNIEVTVKEAFGSQDSITISNGTTLDTRDIRYESQFYVDRTKCAAHFVAQIDRYGVKDIAELLAGVNPTPPRELINSVRVLRGIAQDLVKLGKHAPGVAGPLTDELARWLQVPAPVFTMLAEASADVMVG